MSDPNSPLTRFQIWRTALPPAIRILITVNLAMYIAFVLLSIFSAGDLFRYLAVPFDPGTFIKQPWSALTHGIANMYGGGFWGLISFGFGVVWLNIMGREYEETYGSHQLMGLYVLATLGGTVAALTVGAMGGGGFSFGIWGPVGAIIVCAAVMNPDRGIGLWLIGVISLKWIAIGFVVLDLAFSRDPAHIGAYLVGFLFGAMQNRGVELGGWARPLFRSGSRQRPSPRRSYGSASGGWSPGSDVQTATRTERTPRRTPTASRKASGEPTQADIDSILDKIHEKGIDSLSKDEHKVLKKWSGG